MKMKKFLPLISLMFLVTTAFTSSYTAQEVVTSALSWAAKNPYVITGGLLTVKAFWNTSLHCVCATDDWLDRRGLIEERALQDTNTQLLLEKIQPLAEEHGFKKIFIIATTKKEESQRAPQFGLDRYGDELFIIIPHQLANGILTNTNPWWKEFLIHELGHAVAHHPLYKRMLTPTVGSPSFRSHAALGIALATGISTFSPAVSLLSGLATHATPLYPTAAAACISSAITGTTYHLTKKGLDQGCTRGLNALSRTFERSADAYVAVTATKKNDPHMLENFADGLQDRINQNFIEKGITHPPLKERVATTRAAATELRQRLNAQQRRSSVD
jgi:hypothetical protein